MDTKNILMEYGRFHGAIQGLGQMSLSEEPILKDLKISEADQQVAYRNMKKNDFKGTLVDYLCFVCMKYIVWDFKSNNNADIIQFIQDYQQKEHVSVLLRFFVKNPDYFFQELGAKPDKEIFKRLSSMWFDYFYSN